MEEIWANLDRNVIHVATPIVIEVISNGRKAVLSIFNGIDFNNNNTKFLFLCENDTYFTKNNKHK